MAKENRTEETLNVETLMKELDRLSNQNQILKNKLMQAAEEIKFLAQGEVHKRLEWLWKVISMDNSEKVFGSEFVAYCVSDFMDIMTPQPDENKEPDKKEN